jgi:hypothetical protein
MMLTPTLKRLIGRAMIGMPSIAKMAMAAYISPVQGAALLLANNRSPLTRYLQCQTYPVAKVVWTKWPVEATEQSVVSDAAYVAYSAHRANALGIGMAHNTVTDNAAGISGVKRGAGQRLGH